MKQIGSGGFGSVQLAVDLTSNKLVVTKFIKKSKVYSDSWVEASNGQRLPYEIFFLQQIHHDHIVNMIQFFENDTYFQLVMEKHGFGTLSIYFSYFSYSNEIKRNFYMFHIYTMESWLSLGFQTNHFDGYLY